ncbi:hypothetical protein VNI00_000487 [Paramarasmius palmivorus]|uniref:Protein-S-isoprenylcysteine O-methyltransferase n=1 Tax=Paramarasmius palmivorus TaxID=297713 RepID=A0AAW0E9G8_9AGAR
MPKLYWVASLNEVVYILRTNVDHVDPLLVIGTILAVVGTTMRCLSYRYLGEAFTLELVKAGHRAKDPAASARLVTNGPYTIVRHPSYTGWLIGTFGWIMVHCVEGSWIRNQSSSTLEGAIVKGFAIAWAFIFTAPFAWTLTRMPEEDAMMRRQFGEEWVRWSRRVRYWLIPFVY